MNDYQVRIFCLVCMRGCGITKDSQQHPIVCCPLCGATRINMCAFNHGSTSSENPKQHGSAEAVRKAGTATRTKKQRFWRNWFGNHGRDTKEALTQFLYGVAVLLRIL